MGVLQADQPGPVDPQIYHGKEHLKKTIDDHIRRCPDWQKSFRPLKPGRGFDSR